MLLKTASGAWLASLAALGALAQAPTIRLQGIAQGPEGPSVLLCDSATGRERWSRPGQTFAGFLVGECDVPAGEVRLIRPGLVQRLRLDQAMVPAKPEDAAAVRAAVVANLRRLAAAGYQRCVETGQRQVGFSDIVGRDLPIFQLEPMAGEDYSHLVVSLNGGSLTVLTQGGQTIEWHPTEAIEVHMAPGTSLEDLSRATGVALSELAASNPRLPAGITFPTNQLVALRLP